MTNESGLEFLNPSKSMGLDAERKAALDAWPQPVNLKLGCGVLESEVFDWFCKHETTIRAAMQSPRPYCKPYNTLANKQYTEYTKKPDIKTQPKMQKVDLDGMKQGDFPPSTPIEYMLKAEGWDDAINAIKSEYGELYYQPANKE